GAQHARAAIVRRAGDAATAEVEVVLHLARAHRLEVALARVPAFAAALERVDARNVRVVGGGPLVDYLRGGRRRRRGKEGAHRCRQDFHDSSSAFPGFTTCCDTLHRAMFRARRERMEAGARLRAGGCGPTAIWVSRPREVRSPTAAANCLPLENFPHASLDAMNHIFRFHLALTIIAIVVFLVFAMRHSRPAPGDYRLAPMQGVSIECAPEPCIQPGQRISARDAWQMKRDLGEEMMI